MYTPTVLLSLLAAVAAPVLVEACNSDVTRPPLLWLADLRNANGSGSPDTTLLRGGPGLRKIRFEEGATPIPITAAEKDELEKSGLRFFDVTEVDLEQEYINRLATFGRLDSDPTARIPSAPTQQTAVRAVIATLSQSNLQSDLSALTRYNNRYYRSTTGAQAATDLAAKLRTIASSAPGTGGRVTISTFAHSGFSQTSVIARIEGTTATAAVTIAGAHLDTINQSSPSSGAAPGADDDGSGCVNLIEAFRKLVAAGFKPITPVEFHWYAGEEGGLIGSAAIARSYSSAGKAVKGMMNLDMTAWRQTGTTAQIGFVTDRTNAALTAFGKQLVSTYLTGVIATNDFCGYACSDHASWNTAGYPSVYPFESITQFQNPNIHTARDTTSFSQFSFAHAHEFTKLVVAFVMELGLTTA